MRKTLMALIAAASIAGAAISTPTPAQARCYGCWVGAGVAFGTLFGAAVASGYPYYGYGYAPAYYGYSYYRPRYYGYYGPRFGYDPPRYYIYGQPNYARRDYGYYGPRYYRPYRYY